MLVEFTHPPHAKMVNKMLIMLS